MIFLFVLFCSIIFWEMPLTFPIKNKLNQKYSTPETANGMNNFDFII